MELPAVPDPGQILIVPPPVVAGFDGIGDWHDTGNGRYAPKGWSTAKAAVLRLLHGSTVRDTARAHPDGVNLRLRPGVDPHIAKRVGAIDRVVHATFHDNDHAAVKPGGRTVLVPWSAFADALPEPVRAPHPPVTQDLTGTHLNDEEAIGTLFTDPTVGRIIDRYRADGYPVFIVGGAIRSVLNGEIPNDIDLTTPAVPAESTRMLADIGTVFPLGEQFGTVAVNVHGIDFEVTTHRTEHYDPVSRQPVVGFTTSLNEDLSRRDFTFNAMAVGPDRQLIDPYGGHADLNTGVVKAVGNPDQRFSEDPLRIARAVRFGATLGFTIDPATRDAALGNVDRLDVVSTERFATELDKILKSKRPDVVQAAARLADETGSTGHLFGPLADAARTLPDTIPPEHRFAALTLNSGVDPATLVASMKRGRTEMRDISVTITAVNDLKGGVDPRFVVRRESDESLARLRAITPDVWTPDVQAAFDNRDALRAPLPVTGKDVMATGLKGPAVGEALKQVESVFVRNGSLTRDEALAMLTPSTQGLPVLPPLTGPQTEMYHAVRSTGTVDAAKTVHEVAHGYDELGSVNDALGLDTVLMPDVKAVSKRLQADAGQSLAKRGFPDEFTVHRSGNVGSGVVSVTTRDGGIATFGEATPYTVRRSDVLTDAATFSGQTYGEQELQVDTRDLRRVSLASPSVQDLPDVGATPARLQLADVLVDGARPEAEMSAMFEHDLGGGYRSKLTIGGRVEPTPSTRRGIRRIGVVGAIEFNGKDVGSFSRAIEQREDGTIDLHNESLYIAKAHQHRGVGSAFLLSVETAAREMGVDREYSAALTSGGEGMNGAYTWARAGFDWDQSGGGGYSAWTIGNAMLGEDPGSPLGQQLVRPFDDAGADPHSYRTWAGMALPPDFPTPGDVASDPVGKRVLLGQTDESVISFTGLKDFRTARNGAMTTQAFVNGVPTLVGGGHYDVENGHRTWVPDDTKVAP